MGRDHGLAHAVLVFVIVGVELSTGQDLARTGGHGGVGADDGTFHFLAVHKGFKHHLAVVFQSQCDGLFQFLTVGHLRNTHAGTGVGGLDEHGPAQLCLHTSAHTLQVTLDLPAVGGQPLGVRDVVGFKQGVGHSLVHAGRTCQHAAAHIGDAGQLQQTLHRAVLAPQAVEHRDHHIYMDLFHMTFRREQHHAVVGAVRAEDAGHVAGQLFPAAVCHLCGSCLGIEPAALLCDAHCEHLILGTVNIVDKVSDRNTADLMLTGHTTEQQDNAQLVFRLHDHSLLFIKPAAGRNQTGKNAVSPYYTISMRAMQAKCKNAVPAARPESLQKNFRKSQFSA